MDISDDVAKAKADLSEAKADLSEAKADVSALEAFWAQHKVAAIAVAVTILFIGFAIGRVSAHL